MNSPKQYLTQENVRNVLMTALLAFGATTVAVGTEIVFPGAVEMKCREVRDFVAYLLQGDDYEATAVYSSERSK